MGIRVYPFFVRHDYGANDTALSLTSDKPQAATLFRWQVRPL